MDYVVVFLLILIVLLLFVLLFKFNNKSKISNKEEIKDISDKIINELSNKIYNQHISLIKELNEYKASINSNLFENSTKNIKELELFKDKIIRFLDEKINTYNDKLNKEMDKLNVRVDSRLNEGFDKANKTFINVIMRLQKIDEAQKQIEKLSGNIISLQDVLTDKRSRGAFGEIQLSNILKTLFGENNKKVYEEQYILPNGMRVDCILHLPEPLGDISIDSKFPLESYQKIFNSDLPEVERLKAKRQFKSDVKKHIDDIKSKYILSSSTSNQAIMFLPSEAIFSEINAYHEDIIAYSQKNNVWITSPTTLMSMLTTVQVVLRNIERDKYSHIIQEELVKLSDEFKRYHERWVKLVSSVETVSKNIYDLNITSEKINNRFKNISNVNLAEEEKIDDKIKAIL